VGEWTERAKASGIAELKAFAVKLLQDTEAAVAAMTLPYSQGQTEGRINNLKLVKRSMYGRGNSSVSAHPATRREFELRSSDSRENQKTGSS
jgi:transposase